MLREELKNRKISNQETKQLKRRLNSSESQKIERRKGTERLRREGARHCSQTQKKDEKMQQQGLWMKRTKEMN